MKGRPAVGFADIGGLIRRSTSSRSRSFLVAFRRWRISRDQPDFWSRLCPTAIAIETGTQNPEPRTKRSVLLSAWWSLARVQRFLIRNCCPSLLDRRLALPSPHHSSCAAASRAPLLETMRPSRLD